MTVDIDGIGKCSCWTMVDELSVTAITSPGYDEKVPFLLISKMMIEYRETIDLEEYLNVKVDMKEGTLPFDAIDEYFEKWQDPTGADVLLKIEKELE